MGYHWYFFGGVTLIMIILLLPKVGEGNTSLGEDILLGTIVSSIIGFVLGGIIFMLVSYGFTKDLVRSEEVIIESNKLITLNNTDKIAGNYNSLFFVSSGYIDEVKYYEIYKELNNGDKIYERLRADRVRINYSENPKIVIYGKKYKEEEVKDNRWLTDPVKKEVIKGRTVLYVPKGSIKKEYKVN